jgi:hypothetical protein
MIIYNLKDMVVLQIFEKIATLKSMLMDKHTFMIYIHVLKRLKNKFLLQIGFYRLIFCLFVQIIYIVNLD